MQKQARKSALLHFVSGLRLLLRQPCAVSLRALPPAKLRTQTQ